MKVLFAMMKIMQTVVRTVRQYLDRTVSRERAMWALGTAYVAVFVALAVRSYVAPAYDFDYSPVLVAAAGLGIAATVLWRRQPIGRVYYILPAALILIAIASNADTSRDPFRYLFDGEIIRIWHLSPYTSLPIHLPVDQYSQVFSHTWWRYIPSPYGPLWQALMVAINWVSGNQLVSGLLLLKLVDTAALLVVARYIFLITGKEWLSYCVLINPIILINSAHTPHADIVMAAGLLAAYRHTTVPARAVLLAGIGLIKVHALIFAPFLVRRGRDVALLGGAVAGGVAVLLLCLQPIVGFGLLAMLKANHAGGLTGSYSLLVYNALPWLSPSEVFLASYGLFMASYLSIIVAYFRRRLSSVQALILTSLLVPLLLSGLLYSWHFTITLALLCLSEAPMAAAAVIFITLFGFYAPLNTFHLLIFALLFAAGGYVLRWAYRRLSRRPKLLPLLKWILDPPSTAKRS